MATFDKLRCPEPHESTHPLRFRESDILAALDQLDLCQAAAYISMAVDALDLAAEEALPLQIQR